MERIRKAVEENLFTNLAIACHAAACLFLTSNIFITGQTIKVDGAIILV